MQSGKSSVRGRQVRIINRQFDRSGPCNSTIRFWSPGSAHHRDQFEPWLRGTYPVVDLDREKAEEDRATTTLILPAR
jgi:hypothetical protein